MSQLQELIDSYKAEAKEKHANHQLDEALLEKVTKGLGPSIYNADSSLVSCSDKEERATVKNNFLIKKLGLADSPALDAAIEEVCESMKGNNHKKRALFYYFLVKKFGKEAHYA